jgi:hypothetical protein
LARTAHSAIPWFWNAGVRRHPARAPGSTLKTGELYLAELDGVGLDATFTVLLK